MLWILFWTFAKIGVLSFGGGYAMIPAIEHEVLAHGWMTSEAYSEVIAVAGLSPGPVATNSAIIVGYRAAGVPGAVASALGMALPSLVIIVTLASMFVRMNGSRLVRSAFYGLRPIVTGLVLYAAIHFGIVNGIVGPPTWETGASVLILAVALLTMLKYKWHPLYVILLSGVMGAAFFG
ncbi:chromate transporter [Paenibacillus sp. J31TS4]|uniref:chromate transporter n=1 Tax=Paenibacillus sp. J31TS4 TaxID=2807195 RepID=UPI001B0E088B|nr:chromate transporter [Paenibacillus sp. J31TS4]GIP39340.1 chromate transporter [Paenibacillus sp. J31TS4]